MATVGKTLIVPGGVNAIPSAATGLAGRPRRRRRRRAPDAVADDQRRRGDVRRHGLRGVLDAGHPIRPEPDRAGCSSTLPPAPLLGTGAGHDAGILAAAGIPTAMLFVRNPTGVSHSPAEFAERDDCLVGVEALADGPRRPVGGPS